MARYRVQGPDGAVHVFEGPDGASPDQVTAAASQIFGKKPDTSWLKPDDVGAMQAGVIGAGRTFDRVVKGAQQLYYGATGNDAEQAKLADTAAADDRAYKPLQDQHPIATAVGEAAPAMVIPAGGAATLGGTALRLAVAGALPGALEYGSAGERAGRAAAGGAAGVVGGVVAPKLIGAAIDAVPAAARVVRSAVEPLTEAGRGRIVGRGLNTAAGSDADAAAARLASAAPVVPGSLPTVGQVADNGGLAALERGVSARAPEDFTHRAMEQASARTAALRGIAGDDTAMAAARQVRSTVTDPLYAQAKAQTVTAVDPKLQELLARPSVQKAIERAKSLAAEEGRPFTLELGGPAGPGRITGQTLQDIKMGLDSLLKDPAAGIVGAEANSVKATRGQLMNWMEGAIPELRVARQGYADLSKPINQMQIGSELLDKLAPALAEHGALGRETGAKYAQALRNTDQTVRSATGFRGAGGIADVLTPQQMQLVEGVAADLARKANAQDLGRGAGSDGVQKFAFGPPKAVANGFGLPVVGKVAQALYAGPTEQIQTRLAQALLDPRAAAQLMRANVLAPRGPNVVQRLAANPSRAAQIGGGSTGLALASLFAQ